MNGPAAPAVAGTLMSHLHLRRPLVNGPTKAAPVMRDALMSHLLASGGGS